MTQGNMFKRLVRFEGADGKVYFGDAILGPGEEDVYQATEAYVIEGDVLGEHTVTSTKVGIRKLLTPLDASQIPNIRCVGMNYTKHAIEIKMEIPKWPVLFFKPRSALVGPSDPIVVPAACQMPPAKIDYEVEMVIVIGKQCRDVTPDEAHKYILGYSIGNDVSQRTWQMERGGTQFGAGKMFDTFCPFGPAIVSSSVLPQTSGLKISTKVNGITRQESDTSDMIFDCFKVVSFMSTGTTLNPGDIILTGTPSGVAVGLSPSPYMKEGDEVELYIEKIGKLRNKIEFEHNPEITQRHI